MTWLDEPNELDPDASVAAQMRRDGLPVESLTNETILMIFCRGAGCRERLAQIDDPRYDWPRLQHGPNPEHAMSLDLREPGLLYRVIIWLDEVHAREGKSYARAELEAE